MAALKRGDLLSLSSFASPSAALCLLRGYSERARLIKGAPTKAPLFMCHHAAGRSGADDMKETRKKFATDVLHQRTHHRPVRAEQRRISCPILVRGARRPTERARGHSKRARFDDVRIDGSGLGALRTGNPSGVSPSAKWRWLLLSRPRSGRRSGPHPRPTSAAPGLAPFAIAADSHDDARLSRFQ